MTADLLVEWLEEKINDGANIELFRGTELVYGCTKKSENSSTHEDAHRRNAIACNQISLGA